MTRIRPLDAALEGLRVVRHKPGLILAWTGFYLLSLLAMVGVLLIGLGPKLMTLAPAEAGAGGARDFDQLFARFGLPVLIVIPMAMIMTTMLAAAVYRSILRPQEKAHSYLQFGRDELRLLGLSIIVVVLVAVISGIYGTVVFAAASRLEGFAYGLVTFLTSIGSVALTVWLAIRLSLSAAMTFSERKIRLWEAWKASRGHLLGLGGMWALTILFVFAVAVAGAILTGIVASVLNLFGTLAQINSADLIHISPGIALALLGQLLVQLALQVLLLVLLLVVAYAPPARAYQQLTGQLGNN